MKNRSRQQGILVWLVLVLSMTFALEIGADTKRALLIGIKDYQISGLKSLKGPENDLQLIKKVLLDKFQFQEKNITVLADKEATHTLLEKTFSRFAGEIKNGDFVYIHYSGHGSQIPDQDGDEYPRAYDQTWVPYGSRSAQMKGKDQCDVRDDELHQWLAVIFKKSGNAVFVSDSCHSGSVTRGDGPAIRSAPPAEGDCPFDTKTLKFEDFKDVILIGAVQDDEWAYETSFSGKTYGVFTWYWAHVLQQAQPGDTWRDLFKRAGARVSNRFNRQFPQIFGKSDKQIFDGNFEKTSPTIPISRVWENGKKVRIEVGELSGVSLGSIFRISNNQKKDSSKLPIIEITHVTPFYSEGMANGNFEVGDLVIEESHAYHFDPITIFINGDDTGKEDKKMIARLRDLFTGDAPKISDYKLTDRQQESEIVLYTLRPKQRNGQFIKKSTVDTLPQSFPDQPLELWILDNGEKLLFNDLRIPFSDFSKGLELLETNLKKVIRLKEINNLTSGESLNVDFSTTLWKPVEKPGLDKMDYLELPENKGWLKKQAVYNQEEMDMQPAFPIGSLLTFTLKNKSDVNYYVYLLDIMHNGEVKAIFPDPNDRQQAALLPAGKERNLKDIVLLSLGDPGQEIIKLIIAGTPIDISLLEQETFKIRGGEKGNMTPLERLLISAVHGIRSGRTRVYCNQWGTVQFSITIEKKEE